MVDTSPSEGAWPAFVDFARWIRSKPAFDVEEREFPLELAGTLRGLLAAAAESRPWADDFRRIHGAPRYRISFTTRGANKWLESWAASEDERLNRALASFLDRGVDPVARVKRLAEAATEASEAGVTTAEPKNVLAFGSLFNFAVCPQSAPFIRPALYSSVERALEVEESGHGAPDEEYDTHVRFARQVNDRLAAAGIPVRDMLDTAALVLNAGKHTEFWAPQESDPPRPLLSGLARPAPDGARDESRLSVCTIYLDEASYLKEWIEFHRVVGVERFFLYNNRSRDNHREVLDPYVDEGTVVLHDWPLHPGQFAANEHCVANHGAETRWIAFIDVDEFLFSPQGRPLPEVLEEYEQWPGVGVNWAMFGSSGHRERPAGGVIESYLTRLNLPANATIKSIADPRRVVRVASPHHFEYDRLGTVDENGYPISGGMTRSVSFAKLRINHYFTKSTAEYFERAEKGPVGVKRFDRRFRPDPERIATLEQEIGEHDEAILRFLPALREALGSQSPGSS